MQLIKAHFNTRLKANALYVVLIVGVIVAILLGSFLLLAHHQRLFQLRNEAISNGMSNVNSSFFKYPKSTEGIEVVSNYWGAFRKVLIEDEEHQLKKVALLCAQKDSLYTSVYLEDYHSPLVLAGSASLEGKLELPDGYWKTGAVNGHYFTGKTQLKGIKPSTKMPSIDSKWRDFTEGLLSGKAIEAKESLAQSRMNNSFVEPLQIIQSYGGNYINAELTGHFIVRDDVGIKVSANSELNDIVIVAPQITIESGFKGNIHCIANRIEIEKNVVLNYPSSLIAIEEEMKSTSNDDVFTDIKIGDNVLFNGFVIYLNHKSNLYEHRNIDITLGTNSKIVGDIYSQGYLELKGEVTGSIYTSYFMYDSGRGGKYINYLYNARVSFDQTIAHYNGGLPLASNTEYIVASWLY